MILLIDDTIFFFDYYVCMFTTTTDKKYVVNNIKKMVRTNSRSKNDNGKRKANYKKEPGKVIFNQIAAFAFITLQIFKYMFTIPKLIKELIENSKTDSRNSLIIKLIG